MAMPEARPGAGEMQLERELCRRDAHHFIFETGFVRTKDEHDTATPVKPVPDVPYLRALLDCYLVSGGLLDPYKAARALEAGVPESFLVQLQKTGVLFVEKSRDMYVTNLTCCYLLWRGRSLAHQLILVQSKREEDAAGLVFNKEPKYARLSFMESQLPSWLQAMSFPKAGAYGNLYAPNGSHFRAIPEGAHIIRSEHPSVIFSDEAAFQVEFGAAYTAALPAVEGGGQFLAISSAEAGAFEELVDAAVGVNQPTRIPGLSWRLASETVPVIRLHYAADPAKRPGTPAGEAWRARAALRYTGGTRSPRWRKEMEIEYRAFGGLKVFPEWAERWSQGPPFVIRPFRPVGYRLYGSYDHGWNNPAAFHVHGINPDGDKVTLWEFYADRVPLSAIADIIQGKRVRTPPRAEARIAPGTVVFEGNPFAGDLAWIVADPSLWAEDQVMTDQTNKSTALLFRQHGVLLQRGERGGDSTVAEWLLGDLWIDPAHPKYRITTNCPWLIWELGQQRYKEHSAAIALNANLSETFVDKDNHAWDCYDDQTDILTGAGWKRFAALTPEDVVATWRDGEMVFESPQAIIRQAFDGDLLTYDRGAANFAVTATHRLFVAGAAAVRSGHPEFSLTPLEALPVVSWAPRTARWTGRRAVSPIPGVAVEDVLAWYGFWLAEGCTSRNHRGSAYAHLDQANPDAELTDLMARLGCRMRRRTTSGVTRFSFGKRWYDLVADQGRSWAKRVPDWIRDATPDQLAIVLHWMWKGDGTDAGDWKRYNTVSEGLAGDVQEMIAKVGGAATIGVQAPGLVRLPGGRVAKRRALYHVYWAHGRRGQGGKGAPSLLLQIHRREIRRMPYRGTVFCVSTRSGVIYVRRHGKPMWCGNSLKMFLKRFPPAARLPKAEQRPATFAWWRKQAIAAKRGEPMRTYRREMVG